MVAAIAAALSAADPGNSGLYRANAASLATRLDALSRVIEHAVARVKGVPFVVFHEAFQYLDSLFGLNTVGSLTVNPEQPSGAARLKDSPAPIASEGSLCVLADRQFE